MKTTISLRLLACVLAASLWPALPRLSAAPLPDGIAAIVNGEIITHYEIETDRRYQHEEKQARAQYHDAELTAHLQQLRLATCERLIDERLIIQDFKRRGGSYSDSYLDDGISRTINEHYDGSEARFNSSLAGFGETREEYRDGLYDYDIVYWQTKENVDTKVLPTITREDAARQRAKLRAAWIASLRSDAYIEKMP